jgi:hypothetical protein
MNAHVIKFRPRDKHDLSAQRAPRQRLNDLQLLAEWRDELANKLRRAELLFDHVGIDVGLETLPDEVVAFSRVVAGLFAEEAEG